MVLHSWVKNMLTMNIINSKKAQSARGLPDHGFVPRSATVCNDNWYYSCWVSITEQCSNWTNKEQRYTPYHIWYDIIWLDLKQMQPSLHWWERMNCKGKNWSTKVRYALYSRCCSLYIIVTCNEYKCIPIDKQRKVWILCLINQYVVSLSLNDF